MKHVLILGGGFAGVQAALTLSRLSPHLKITLINDTPYHSFHADLYEVATAILPSEKKIDFKQLAGTVNIPLHKIFSHTRVHVITEKVTSLNLQQKTVLTSSSSYPYDFLVIAVGSKTNFFDIPGAEEYGHPFKTTEDALNIRNDIEELVSTKNTPVHVVVAGGGLSGVEVAAQMTSFMRDIARKYQKPGGNVTIINASDSLMAGTTKWVKKLGMSRIRERKVKILVNTRIEKVSQDTVYCSEGKEIAYDYLIWTTGIMGNILESQIKGVTLTGKRQIIVGQDLQTKEYPGVYAIGDVAYMLHDKTSIPIPTTAWAAISMGKHAASNIARQFLGNTTLPFHPKPPMFVVPLGKKQGVGVVGTMRVSGMAAWGVKRLITLKYFSSILPKKDAINLWRRGVSIFIHND